MTDDRSTDLLSALPRSRPHRRSEKRPARAPAGAGEAAPAGEAEAKATEAKATEVKPSGTARPARAKSRASHSRASQQPRTRPNAKPARPKTTRSATAAPQRLGKPTSRGRQGRLPQPAQPRGVPPASPTARPQPTTDFPVLRTAVQAAAELAEIGMTLSAKALRGALGRFPRP
jgi:hypothetical protein